MIKNNRPLHPGVVLSEIYMKEMGLNQSELAKMCACTPKKINEIVNGKRGISSMFALELEKAEKLLSADDLDEWKDL